MPAKTIKITLTTGQLLEAYKTHGNDMVIIDIDNARKHKQFAQYIDVHIKLADGSVAEVHHWHMSNEGVVVSSKIRAPEKRQYESIRMGLSLMENDEDNSNTLALKCLCDAFSAKMTQMIDEGIITNNEKAPRKQADGTYRPFHLISTKIETPMQTTAYDRESEEYKDLENPRFWITLPKKSYYGKPKPEPEQFEDKCYVDDAGTPDEARPIMVYEFDPTFYNVDEGYHNKRTGKKYYKKLGDDKETESGDVVRYLDNTNIHKFLTKGSALIGNFKFEVVVSGRQCKLEVKLTGQCHVKSAVEDEDGYNEVDEEEIGAFGEKRATIKTNYASLGKSEEDDDDEDADCDYDNE